jgi:uncharacterized ubiquitin-like protein YukD
MSSSTSRVSLYKPAGGENVNVTTDLNNNYDKIDTNLNFRVAANATARNAISPFWEGLNVRDTDTGKCWVSNGSAPASSSWDQIATANTYTTAINVAPAATGTIGANFRAGSDTNNRFQIRGDGQIAWGTGSATPDVNLYRSAANTLKTDDYFFSGDGIFATNDLESNAQLKLYQGGTTKLNSQPSTSTTVSSSTTETVIATYSIPGNDMSVGSVYKLTAFGTISTNSTGTNQITIRGRVNGLSGTQFGTTNAVTMTNSLTTKVVKIEVYAVCLATGASGSVFAQIDVWNGGTIAGLNPTNFGSATNNGHIIDGGTPSTVDTTTTTDLVITVQWSASSSNNSFICRGFAAERIA